MFLPVDPWNYRLHVLIHGISEDLNFDIEQQTGQKLQSILAEPNEDNAYVHFFCFSCTEGRRVAVSIYDIEMVNYLQDIWRHEVEESEEIDEEAIDVEIYFRDRPHPYRSVAINEEEIDFILNEFESNPFIEHQYLSFTDEDDEIVTVNVGHIILFSAKNQVITDEFTEDEVDGDK